MRGSQSSPSLRQEAMRGTIPHRGSHDVGAVLAGGEDVYVPRAMWTETFDSPLKQRGATTAQWVQEMGATLQKQATLKQHLTQELGKQTMTRATLRQAGSDEQQDLRRATMADAQRQLDAQQIAKEEAEKKKHLFKGSLDAQVADATARMHDSRMREAYDAAEVKLRTVQQLCQEVAAQESRKKAAKRESDEALAALNAKKAQQRADRQRDIDETRDALQKQSMNEEYRLSAQQTRLKAAQETQERAYKQFAATAGHEDDLRMSREMQRQDDDERRHQMLSELHYSRREIARDRQRQRMVSTLDAQAENNKRTKQLVGAQLRAEKEAVREASRSCLDQEVQKMQAKRREELEVQSTNIKMMAEKQARAKSEGRKPIACNTMAMTDGLLSYAAHGSKIAVQGMEQRMDASKHLTKPCGKPELKPWIEINRSLGVGGVNGIFGGEGGTRPSLMATGGANRILTKSMSLAERDKKMSNSWSEGLTPEERKLGMKAAARRGAIAAADKKEVP